MKYALPLAILGIACTAAAQVPTPDSVKQSVDALAIAGPWLGLILVALGYVDMRRREGTCRDSIAVLNTRIDALQEQRVASSEKDATTLHALAREIGEIVSKNAMSNERVADVLERLIEKVDRARDDR